MKRAAENKINLRKLDDNHVSNLGVITFFDFFLKFLYGYYIIYRYRPIQYLRMDLPTGISRLVMIPIIYCVLPISNKHAS